jgi:hypothetical protein
VPSERWNALNEGEMYRAFRVVIIQDLEINNKTNYLLPLECGQTLPPEWGELNFRNVENRLSGVMVVPLVFQLVSPRPKTNPENGVTI